MVSPKERLSILKGNAESCLREVALKRFGVPLAEEIIGLVKELDDEKRELKGSEFPYTEMAELQDPEGKFFVGYIGSSIVEKVGLSIIVSDVYYITREKLHENCKNIEVKSPEVSSLVPQRPVINYEENLRFPDSTLRLFAQAPRSLFREVNMEIIEKQEFRPTYWRLDKYFGIGNIELKNFKI